MSKPTKIENKFKKDATVIYSLIKRYKENRDEHLRTDRPEVDLENLNKKQREVKEKIISGEICAKHLGMPEWMTKDQLILHASRIAHSYAYDEQNSWDNRTKIYSEHISEYEKQLDYLDRMNEEAKKIAKEGK